MPATKRNITVKKSFFRSYQRKNLICNISAGKLIVIAAVAGGITLNPVVIATLTGVGLIVKAVATFKKYDKKVEQAIFQRSSTKKSLTKFDFTSGMNLSTKKRSSTD